MLLVTRLVHTSITSFKKLVLCAVSEWCCQCQSKLAIIIITSRFVLRDSARGVRQLCHGMNSFL